MRRNKSFRFWILAVLIGVALPASAAELPKARPEIVGLSSARLERLSVVMQRYVDEGRLGGAVALVARGGKVAYLQAFGKLDPATGRAHARRRHLPHRLADQGGDERRRHDPARGGPAPARRPRLKIHPRIRQDHAWPSEAPEKDAKGYTIVPAKRPITIRDLLTHTAGISYGDGPAKDRIPGGRPPAAGSWPTSPIPIGDVIKKLAGLPFDAQPGEKFVYGYNTDILGYLVEVVSGMSLADFVAKRITGPLGMADTHFFLPEEKIGRFTAVYGIDEEGEA